MNTTTTTTNTVTTEMNQALVAALKGCAPVKAWGRRVRGDMNGVTLEFRGEVHYYSGPFVSVRGGDQVAIVRFS